MGRFFAKINNQAGQTIVEYILVLVVVVSIILGGLYQLNDAFRVFANNYFGDYWSCLLETGELPSFGGEVSGECSQIYKQFSLADGRPLVTEGSGAGGNSGSGNNSGDNNSKTEADEAGEKFSSNDSGGGGSSIAQTIPNNDANVLRSNNNRFRVNRSRSKGFDGKDDSTQSSLSGGAVTDLSGYAAGNVVRIPLRDSEKIRDNRYEIEDDGNEQNNIASNLGSGNAEKVSPQMMRIERKIAATDDGAEIEELTFGKLLRLLIIAAIVIAIVIFIGGQILQVSKSMD